MKVDFIQTKLSEVQIREISPLEPVSYLKILEKMTFGEDIALVNIICPGYKKEREKGVEEFNFVELSENVNECPNVILMLEKMNKLIKVIKSLGFQDTVNIKIILADVAILNYENLNKKQDVKKTMDIFYKSVRKYICDYSNVELLKMSELPYEFKKVPLCGVSPKSANLMYEKANKVIRKKADEYTGSLIFERVNQLMSTGIFSNVKVRKIVKRSKKEVKRFLAEYGLAGLGIRRIYENPIVLFTEPSGYMRGFFYNAFLKKKDNLSVMYLC